MLIYASERLMKRTMKTSRKIFRFLAAMTIGTAMSSHAFCDTYNVSSSVTYNHYVQYSHQGSLENSYSIQVPAGYIAFITVKSGDMAKQNTDGTNKFRLYDNEVPYKMSGTWTAIGETIYCTTFSSSGTIRLDTYTAPTYYREMIYGQNSLGPYIVGYRDIYYSSYYVRQNYTIIITFESCTSKRLVAFESNGGSLCQSRLYSIGGKYSTFPIPSKRGYDLVGWYSDYSLTKEVKTSDMVSSSVAKLYAKWEKTPTLSDLYITGPSKVESGSRTEYTCTAVLSNGEEINVPGIWMMASGKDYASISSGTLRAYETTTDRKVTIRVDWSKTVNGATNSRIALKEVTIKAGAELVSVAFDAMGGSTVSPCQYEVGSIYGTLPTPKKNGYIFQGWYTSSSFTTQVTTSSSVNKSVTKLYAKWSLEEYTITFNKQNGVGGSDSAKASYNGDLPSISIPSRTDKYIFGGYFSSAGGGGTQYYSENGTPTRKWDKTSSAILYAKWNAPLPVSLVILGDDTVLSGGNCTYVCKVNYDNGTSVVVSPQWSIKNGSEYGTLGTSSGTFTANGTLIQREVTIGAVYDYLGGSVSAQKVITIQKSTISAKISSAHAAQRWPWNGIVDVDYTISLSPSGAKAVVRVAGYDVSRQKLLMARIVTGVTNVTSSGTYRLNWDVGQDYPNFNTDGLSIELHPKCLIPVLFESNGGSSCAMQEFVEGEAYGSMPTTSRSGYTFGGWYLDSELQTPVTSSTIVNGNDAKLYAKWNGNACSISFDKQSGTGGTTSTTATYGSAMPSITIPSRAGYAFEGYYSATGGGGTQYYTDSGASARVWDRTSSATLYAKWTPITSAITFDKQSGTGGTASTTATYGSAMPSITIPSRTGYTFCGYYTATGGSGTQYYTDRGASARVWDRTSSATLYAKWMPITCTITFDKQGGTGGTASTTATYGSAMPSITIPTRTYYRFCGYYTEANGTGTQYYTASGKSSRASSFYSATKLYAKWEIDGTAPYIVVDISGGTSASSYPVTCLSSIPSGGWTDSHKTTKIVLRLIPAGTFTMGCPSSEIGYIREVQHKVTLTKPFYIGIFELTQKQYTLIMGSNPSKYKGDARPVETVSWNTIRGLSSTYNWPSSGHSVAPSSFMGKLRSRSGLMFDLPTEAQWEYACRAGTTTAFNNGGTISSSGSNVYMNKVGRYNFNQNDGKGGYSGSHTTVGSYDANNWGIYDMHGNVREWCLDWYTSFNSNPVTDPVGAESDGLRIERGGDYACYAEICRATSYGMGYPSDAFSVTGFRVSCLITD